MSGEVAIRHSAGGDLPDTKHSVGLLGIDLSKRKAMAKIEKIYNGERWRSDIPIRDSGY
jgi:hypothetical protein